MPIESTSLADLVIADSRRARVLEGLGLDYCCHGQQILSEASEAAGLRLNDVVEALTFPDPAPTPADGPRDTSALAHDIVDSHHAYMWEEMPRLQALVDKVHQVHGDLHPELEEVRDTFLQALAALDPHMTREERSVFPAISRLEKGQPSSATLTLPETIDELIDEHVVVGDLFRKINTLTGQYAVPEGACGSYTAMLTGLQEMELDLHEHIHKENNILFPKALKLAGR